MKERTEMEENEVKKEIEDRLRSTKREGVEDLIDYMNESGFYTAPASGGNHLHKEGGLAEHTLNVLHCAERISVALIGGKEITEDMRNSIVIASILHDLGKMGDYGKRMYVPNVLKSGKQSESKPYKRNPELYNIPHGLRSNKLAALFIDLTPDEELAVMYHDGFEELSNRVFLGGMHKFPPLLMIIHWADMWASQVIEDGSEEDTEE